MTTAETMTTVSSSYSSQIRLILPLLTPSKGFCLDKYPEVLLTSSTLMPWHEDAFALSDVVVPGPSASTSALLLLAYLFLKEMVNKSILPSHVACDSGA